MSCMDTVAQHRMAPPWQLVVCTCLLACLLPQLLLPRFVPPAVAHKPVAEAHNRVTRTPGTHLLPCAVPAHTEMNTNASGSCGGRLDGHVARNALRQLVSMFYICWHTSKTGRWR